MKNSHAEVSPVFYSNAERAVEGVSKETFDKWLDSSGRKMKEFADHSIVKDALERGEGGEKAELPEGFDTALRDKLVEGMREADVPASTDWEESQRLVDEYNGKVKLMGSRVEKRKKRIASELEGRELTAEQQTVVDVYTGRKNIQPLVFTDKEGKKRRIIMRQGIEKGKGNIHWRAKTVQNNCFDGDEQPAQ